MNPKKLLNLYGLKWNPFMPDLPEEALLVSKKIESFAWRVETLVHEGGFALITGDPGTGKSVALRILAERLKAIRDVVVGVVTAQLLNALLPLAIGQLEAMGWPTGLMVSLGAGLYEELLFRVLLVSGLLWLGRRALGLAPVAATAGAVVVGAVVFSAFHYLGPFGDRLEAGSFVFRAVAGLAFSALYVTRGFGITAWTHALYDFYVLTLYA